MRPKCLVRTAACLDRRKARALVSVELVDSAPRGRSQKFFPKNPGDADARGPGRGPAKRLTKRAQQSTPRALPGPGRYARTLAVLYCLDAFRSSLRATRSSCGSTVILPSHAPPSAVSTSPLM